MFYGSTFFLKLFTIKVCILRVLCGGLMFKPQHTTSAKKWYAPTPHKVDLNDVETFLNVSLFVVEYSVWKKLIFSRFFKIMILIKKFKCFHIIRISFVPRKIRYNYFFHKYCSFPYTFQKLKKKILIDALVQTVIRIFWNSCKWLKYLNLLQGVFAGNGSRIQAQSKQDHLHYYCGLSHRHHIGTILRI